VSVAPSIRSARASRQVLLVASLAAFMAFLDTTIVNIAFPALQRAFPAQPTSSISWVLNGYNIVFAALLVAAGQLADRHSHRRLFLLGLALFTLASACCAGAPTLTALVAYRVFQGIGAAIMIPTGMALLLDAYPPAEQIQAIALLAAVSGVAFAAGPAIGGILIHALGWRSIFLVNAPIGLLALINARRLRPETRCLENSARLPDFKGALSMAIGVGLVALAIVQGNGWGWTSTPIIVSFVAGGCLIGAAIWRAASHQAPAIELDLFRVRRFSVANIAVFAFAIGLAAKLLCDVLFMTSVWGYSEFETGLAVSVSPLVTAAVARTAARVAIRVGMRLAAVLGGALYLAGCAWYATRMGTKPQYLTAYLPGTVCTGTGIALILPTLTSTAVMSVPPHRLAAGAGINSMIRQLGAVLGVALFVAVVGTPTPSSALAAFHHGWILAAVASGTAALASIALRADPSTEPRHATAEPQPSVRNARLATPGPRKPWLR
jgi:EmrB/QacA subfamily drug resistance transporter